MECRPTIGESTKPWGGIAQKHWNPELPHSTGCHFVSGSVWPPCKIRTKLSFSSGAGLYVANAQLGSKWAHRDACGFIIIIICPPGPCIEMHSLSRNGILDFLNYTCCSSSFLEIGLTGRHNVAQLRKRRGGKGWQIHPWKLIDVSLHISFHICGIDLGL